MGRVSTTGGFSNSNNDAFRAWVSEIISMLQSAGLVRTADSGQIDEMTVNRPSSNSWAGSAIFRFNDALQAAAPVYLRLQFGTGASSTYPALSVQIGTGSDGAGLLTGLVSQEHVMRANASPGGGADYISRAVHTDGFAALVYKIGASSSATQILGVGFVVQRTVDNAGAPSPEGVMLITPPTGANSVTSNGVFSRIVYTSAVVPDPISTAWLGRVHGGLTDSRVGLSPQAFHHWIATPKLKPLAGTVGFIRGEVPTHSQFTLAMVGTVARNYISVGPEMGNVLSASANSDMAILWED
jgi:hypothetical protein